ncbi:AAA family ATPase [Anaerotignum propionicum]|uniref:AAA domain-containing protein, putative AbiEii toxin, Type IV TA system n=1 Tax=Anaerotignum propionicum DSM 1682 TaxID=991789 RepID=A0A0X1U7T6_ANAPI|nr:AAA family ATPase [Anaerotignum propionicum]AMJ41010.1 hypothetical protein CPRO_14170 [Anaerotignum propionicum DSM 1682]SHE61244.1 AAA domain-containing protein, putative AbiEii toxin, Type IV TA system [[Clostridium] propionicum DSM 1682] [Anaerotignum propionicum DSM 1682]
MQIKNLYIKNYKKFNDKHIIFRSQEATQFEKSIYGNMKVTLFAGLNGSGKTTILSFIVLIFRYLQRFRERVPCDYMINYEIELDKIYDITLKKDKDKIYFIKDNNSFLLKEYDIKKKDYITLSVDNIMQIDYDEMRKYLPGNIISLGFDVDYPQKYSFNYVGDRLVQQFQLESVYAKGSYGLDLSIGIVNFFYSYIQNQDFHNIINDLGISLNNTISIYNDFYSEFHMQNYDYEEYKSTMSFLNDKSITPEERKEANESFDRNVSNEIKDAIKKLKKYTKEKDDRVFFDIIRFLSDGEKNYDILCYLCNSRSIFINDLSIIKDDKAISIIGMSTGEKTFLFRLFYILSRVCDNSIIILEEPETHLNYVWIRQLMPIFITLFEGYDIHLLISSHSQTFINMLFKSQILLIDNNDISNPCINTFMANESVINHMLFSHNTNYNVMENNVIKQIKKCRNKDDLLCLLDEMGESLLRFLIYKEYKDFNGDEPTNVENHK